MILKLTAFPDGSEALATTKSLLVNLDHIAAIHGSKLVRKVPIIGEENEVNGSVITLNSGTHFPVRESPEAIFDIVPVSMKPQAKPGPAQSVI